MSLPNAWSTLPAEPPTSRASYQQLHTVEHSLAKLLELQSRQEIEISKENMAAYLGISVRSLNRGLRNLLSGEDKCTGSE